MMLLMPHVAARLFDVPLMIDPGKMAAIMAGLGARIVEGGIELAGVEAVQHVAFAEGRPSETMGRLGDRLGRRYEQAGVGDRIVDRVGSVAVIPIEGSLVHKGAYLGAYSGRTSYEGIQTQIARAARDPAVKGVVFEVDSFGGEVPGVFATSRMIASLSAVKPTLAILTEHAYSAGYLLAAAARQIVIPETGGAGSIGAMMMHADLSQKLANDGIKVSVIASGAHKADGHPALPLSDETRARMQARVDASRDLFAEVVGSFRGQRLTKAAALATEAADYPGEKAVRAGLVDGVMDPNEAFDAFVKRIA